MVFGVADANVPMRESLKNLIQAVGFRTEVFTSDQEFAHSHICTWKGKIGIPISCSSRYKAPPVRSAAAQRDGGARAGNAVEGLNRGDHWSGAPFKLLTARLH